MFRFCTYLLLFALTLQSFYRSVMVLDYEIHLPNYIAQCINKAKPQLHCNGQCVLMKKIKEKEKQEAKKNMLVYEYSAHYTHKEPLLLMDYNPVLEFISPHFSPYYNSYSYSFKSSLFRPPIV